MLLSNKERDSLVSVLVARMRQLNYSYEALKTASTKSAGEVESLHKEILKQFEEDVEKNGGTIVKPVF